jgi:hypothetical protein
MHWHGWTEVTRLIGYVKCLLEKVPWRHNGETPSVRGKGRRREPKGNECTSSRAAVWGLLIWAILVGSSSCSPAEKRVQKPTTQKPTTSNRSDPWANGDPTSIPRSSEYTRLDPNTPERSGVVQSLLRSYGDGRVAECRLVGIWGSVHKPGTEYYLLVTQKSISVRITVFVYDATRRKILRAYVLPKHGPVARNRYQPEDPGDPGDREETVGGHHTMARR